MVLSQLPHLLTDVILYLLSKYVASFAGVQMKKFGFLILTFLLAQILLTGCSQEKVMDTDFIRLQNKVKDLEATLKQREEENVRLNQQMTDVQNSLNQQNEQITKLIEASQNIQTEKKHPVIIQDVKITSEKMDAKSRIFGPYNLNVTLYNATDRNISDSLSTILVGDHPTNAGEAPQIQQIVRKFELKPKESKIVTFTDLPVNDPAKRLNIIVKLLENTSVPDEEGVSGNTTWVVVPTIIFPPGHP